MTDSALPAATRNRASCDDTSVPKMQAAEEMVFSTGCRLQDRKTGTDQQNCLFNVHMNFLATSH